MKIAELKAKHPKIYRQALKHWKCKLFNSETWHLLTYDRKKYVSLKKLYFDNSHLATVFTWEDTSEGFNLWLEINAGDFQLFYDYHKIPNPETFLKNEK